MKLLPLILILPLISCASVGEPVIDLPTVEPKRELPADPIPAKQHPGGLLRYKISSKNVLYNQEAHMKAFKKAQDLCSPFFMDPQLDEWRVVKDKKALMKKKRVLVFSYKCNIL